MGDSDQTLWNGMLTELRSHHATICRQWFDQIQPVAVERGTLHLRTQSVVHRDYLRRHCLDSFNDAARTLTGTLLSVRFLGPEDEPEAAADRAEATASKPGNDRPGVGRRATRIPKPASTEPAQPGRDASPTETPPAAGASQPGRSDTEGPAASQNGSLEHTPSDAGSPDPRLREPKRITIPSGATPGGASAGAHDDGFILNPDCSFDTFVKGPQNRLAHAAAVAVAEQPGQAYNPLFIHGGVGLGKTHLLQAVCLHIFAREPHANIYYVSCEAFMTQYIEAVQAGHMSEFRHRFRDVDVLIVDDVHFLAKGEATQEEFFHTFNALQNARKQIVLSSDARPEDIPHLEERLVSRFKWGVVTPIEKPGFETRLEIVRQKSALHGYDIKDDVAEFIAARVDTNIRELEGAISQVMARSRFDERPVSVELAKEALGDITLGGAESAVTLPTIIGVVTDFYNVRLADLQSKRRQRSIAQPRQVCMWLARQLTTHSLEEVGGSFGGRDHTTVMHAVKTVDDRAAQDPEFKAVLDTLLARARRS